MSELGSAVIDGDLGGDAQADKQKCADDPLVTYTVARLMARHRTAAASPDIGDAWTW